MNQAGRPQDIRCIQADRTHRAIRFLAPSLIGSQYCSWKENLPRLIFWNRRACHSNIPRARGRCLPDAQYIGKPGAQRGCLKRRRRAAFAKEPIDPPFRLVRLRPVSA